MEFLSTVTRGDCRDMRMNYPEWRETVDEVRQQWNKMWRERIDDDVLAEGIANQEFPKLFVEQGSVIIATRDYRPPDFEEILEKNKPEEMKHHGLPPNPSEGGYGKFIREVISNQKRYSLEDKHRRIEQREKEKKNQPLKHGGRGWLHNTR